jgi:hypothetical protein
MLALCYFGFRSLLAGALTSRYWVCAPISRRFAKEDEELTVDFRKYEMQSRQHSAKFRLLFSYALKGVCWRCSYLDFCRWAAFGLPMLALRSHTYQYEPRGRTARSRCATTTAASSLALRHVTNVTLDSARR